MKYHTDKSLGKYLRGFAVKFHLFTGQNRLTSQSVPCGFNYSPSEVKQLGATLQHLVEDDNFIKFLLFQPIYDN